MNLTIHEARGDQLRVVIAGAGVAGLEAALALHTLAGGLVEVEILTPDQEFSYRPLAVAQPFDLASVRRFDIRQIAAEAGASVVPGRLASVDSERRVARTRAGEEIDYDALVIATGARGEAAVPGASTFLGEPSAEGFRAVLNELEAGMASRAAFVVPAGVSWSLPLYELALMTANRMAERGISDRELTVVTTEDEPLGVFGEAASREVRALLAGSRVELVTSTATRAFAAGRLLLDDREPLVVDHVVALPVLKVPSIPGVPQGTGGFIPTDPHGRVEGHADLFAVGDATWFPIKQGGIAAQQADLAAAAIAADAGAQVDPGDPGLVLRGALLTGGSPRFLRGDSTGESVATTAALWWPPGKIAGRYLAPVLARLSRDDLPIPPLADLDQHFGSDPEAVEAGHREALALALEAADAEAGWGDTATALRWLDVAEQLNITLPPEYVERRERWRDELAGVSVD